MPTKQQDKTKVHTRYYLADGTEVPGVTTVLRILDKPALIHWAWKLGTQGIDYKKVRDKAADIGTIAHYLIECHIRGQQPDLSEYSQANIDKAETAFLAYLEWEKDQEFETLGTERQLVSEKYGYGGTLDRIVHCHRTGQLGILDYKTSTGIYPEMKYQAGGYWQLWTENHKRVPDWYRLLRIDKETGEFEEHKLTDLHKYWDVFRNTLATYQAIKKIKK